MPFFSIVIPLYNKGPYISKSIDSVLKQTFDDYEVVVVDDGSTDDGAKIIQNRYQSDKIRLIKKVNGGPSSARNRGVQESKGEWIVFLDADDLLLPNALATFANMISKYSEIEYFVCNYYISQNNKATLFTYMKHDGFLKAPFFMESIRELTERAGSSTIKRSLALKFPFNESLRRYEDAEVQYEIMRSNPVYQCSIPVMISVRDAASASSPREDVREDFEGNLIFEGKSYWEQMALYILAVDCKRGYPIHANKMYRKIYRRLDLKVTYYLILAYWLFKLIYSKIFRVNKVIRTEQLLEQYYGQY